MNFKLSVIIGDLAETIRGVTYEKAASSSSLRQGYSPLIRATNIDHGELVLDSFVYVPDAVIRDGQRLRAGDIVLAASSGSLSVVGKAALLRSHWHGTFGAFCYAVRPKPERVVPEYLAYFMQTSIYRGCVAKLAAGVNINNLRREHIESIELPLFALAEQRRIVEVVDSYLTRLDDAVASLERAQAKLKAYRASVLKAAVEGRLVPTEASLARAEKRDCEPAEVLLVRIIKERRRRWEEAELAKRKAAGKTPKDDKWKAKYEEPAAPDASMLPRLPEGWRWASVDQLTDGARNLAYGVLVPGPDVTGGVPLVRVGDMHDGTVSTSELKRIDRAIADQFVRTYLRGGEVLLSLVGTIVRSAVVPTNLSGANVARAVGVIPISSLVRSRWVEMWFRSPRIQALMNSQAHEVARKTLNLEDVRAAVVAVPPVAEQDRIIAEAEDLESVAVASASTVTANSVRCARLRQAVLKWAFEGRLVDQDPAEESVEKLLARIRADRAAVAPTTISRGRRAK